MDTPFMDIVQSGPLRGFTELTRFYMSDLNDSSFFLLFSFRSVFILYTFVFTHCSPKLFVCVLVIERSAKQCTTAKNLEKEDYDGGSLFVCARAHTQIKRHGPPGPRH